MRDESSPLGRERQPARVATASVHCAPRTHRCPFETAAPVLSDDAGLVGWSVGVLALLALLVRRFVGWSVGCVATNRGTPLRSSM